MKNRKTLAGALTLLALGAMTQMAPPRPAHAADSQANAATLEETLRRLEKTLTRHGSRSVGGIIRRLDSKGFRGCKITYDLTPQTAPDHRGFVPFTERITIDLSALDPARVSVRAGESGLASVSFATRDDKPRIEHRLADEPHRFGEATRFRSHHPLFSQKGAGKV